MFHAGRECAACHPLRYHSSTVLFEIPNILLILVIVNPLSTKNTSWSSDTLKEGRPLRPVNELSALYVGTLDCCAPDKHAMADPIPAARLNRVIPQNL